MSKTVVKSENYRTNVFFKWQNKWRNNIKSLDKQVKQYQIIISYFLQFFYAYYLVPSEDSFLVKSCGLGCGVGVGSCSDRLESVLSVESSKQTLIIIPICISHLSLDKKNRFTTI